MEIYQTVRWDQMPELLERQYRDFLGDAMGQNTYYYWEPEDYEPCVFITTMSYWLMSQGCDLSKPIMILVWW